MKFLLVVLFVGLGACSASVVDSTNFVQRQKDILRLFKYINQLSYYKDHVEIADKYKFYENADQYTKPEVMSAFNHYYQYGALLPRGEIFSVFHKGHLKQAIALFNLFYYAKDYETFYKTAVWARNNVNEGMFVYSLSVALIHRPDTYYYNLPPIYEVNPYYFYSSKVIEEAQIHKQMYTSEKNSKHNNVVIVANYSGSDLAVNHEQFLSYFMEDVGINAFYYYYNLYYPFWMDGEEFNLKNDNRSLLFSHIYQQILARYYLERLSNGYGAIESFTYDLPFPYGYYPSLRYANGMEFPTRPNEANLYKYFYNYKQKLNFKNKYGLTASYVTDIEVKISNAIELGFIYTKSGEKVDLYSKEGLKGVGNLLEGSPDLPNYKYYGMYQIMARVVLGYSPQPLDHNTAYPSALEHLETSMRDPAFYMLYKRLFSYLLKYKYQKLDVTKTDINSMIYKGVTVKKMEFDRLITYFDDFYADLSNAVYVTPEEFVDDSFKIKVVQKRLSYKPFTYKVYVNSDTDQEVVVKVFLGPKYNMHGRYANLTENFMSFVQFDHFTYQLKTGDNVITKDSKDIYNYMHDRNTAPDLVKKAYGAYDKNGKFSFNKNQIMFGFPEGYKLPKGSYSGTAYQFFVLVTPYVPAKTYLDQPMVGSAKQYVDQSLMGFPFIAPLEFEQMYYSIPNAYFYEAKIYHRKMEDINVSSKVAV